MHPGITINNNTYTNSTGQDLALAICAAYREAPDECEISWKVAAFGQNDEFEGLQTPHNEDEIYEQALDSENHIVTKKGDKKSIFARWELYAIIVVIAIINILVMLYVRSRMKNQMQYEMNSSVSMAVTQYFALSG